jgi:hypothetical protein
MIPENHCVVSLESQLWDRDCSQYIHCEVSLRPVFQIHIAHFFMAPFECFCVSWTWDRHLNLILHMYEMWDNSIEHCEVSTVHAMKVYRRVDISLHTRWNWVVSLHSSCFTPRKEHGYPFNRTLFANWSGCFGIIHCLICFFLFIVACVALLDLHPKVAQHMNMVSEKSCGDKQNKVWFSLIWLHFKSMTLWMRWTEDSCCVYCDVQSSVTCWLPSDGK